MSKLGIRVYVVIFWTFESGYVRIPLIYIFQDTRLRLRVSTLGIGSGHVVGGLDVQARYKALRSGFSGRLNWGR